MTGGINNSYSRLAIDFSEEDISRDLLRFGILIFMVIGGKGFPDIFVIFVLA
jgi:hypothetical protein